MKDETYNTRMERSIAEIRVLITTFEAQLGRLERLTGTLSEKDGASPPPTDSQPPFDPESKELAEKVIRAQLEELKERAADA